MAVVDQLVALLSYRIEGEQNLRKFQRSLDGLEASALKVARGMRAFAAAFAGAVAATGLGALVKGIVDVNAKFETFAATLETLEGSSQKAQESLDWIRKFAKQTPYEVEGITKAFVKLKSLGFDPMDGSLKTLGDAASAMGLSLDQVVNAYADAATTEFERLKELGVTTKLAGDQVTFTWVKNGETLTKTVKKNQTEITNFLREHFEKNFGGAMLKRMTTWTGMMSNLADAWTDFKQEIGEAGFFDTIKANLKGVLDQLDRWDKDGTIKAAAKMISDVLVKAVNAAVFVFQRFMTHARAFGKVLNDNQGWIKKVALELANLALITNPFLWLEDIATYLEGGESLFGDMMKEWPKVAEALKNMFGGMFKDGIIENTLREFRAIPGAFEALRQLDGNKLWENTEREIKAISKEWSLFEKNCKDLWAWLQNAWAGKLPMQKAFEDFLEWLNTWVGSIRNQVVDFGKRLGEYILDGLKSVGQQITDFFWSVIPQKIREWMGVGGSSGSDQLGGGSGSDTLAGGTGGARVHRTGLGGGGGGDGGSGYGYASQSANAAEFNAGMAEGGLGSVQRAAAMGSAQQESNFNPHAWNRKEGAGGIIQWRHGRQRALRAFAASRGESGMGSPRTQGLFFALEAQGKMRGSDESRGSRRFLSAESVDEASRALHGNIRWGHTGARHGHARAWKDKVDIAPKKVAPAGTSAMNFQNNTGRIGSAGATINSGSRVANSNVNVTAPVNVHVANSNQAPDATARAVGAAVNRGARVAAAPSRMQASPAA